MKTSTTKFFLPYLVDVLLLLTIFATAGYAEVPLKMNYQGYLTDADGNPVADGNYEMFFFIYNASSGGSALWDEAQTVAVANGVFNVVLGQPGNELKLADFDGQLYLGVQVEDNAEMTPRQPLTSVGFALKAAKADDADTLDGLDSTMFLGAAGGTMSGDLFVDGNVGINAESPKAELHVSGDTYAKGHLYLYAYEGDGASGTAYVQARDDSGTSNIGMQFRTQKNGNYIDALYIDEDGNVGIGTTSPDSPLHIDSGLWDLSVSEGAFKIGSATHRLKMGVAKDGDGEGDAFIRSHGGTNRLMLGSGTSNVLTVQDEKVGVGTITPSVLLDVLGKGSQVGGVGGFNEVLGHFKRDTVGHSAISVDALPGQDPIVYFAEDGKAIWDLRTDTSESSQFHFRYQGGTGENSPVMTLDASGNVGIEGEFQYKTKKVLYHNMSAADFIKDEKLTATWSNLGVFGYVSGAISSARVNLVAPLHLPEGANITEFTLYYYDNDTSYDVYVQAFVYKRGIEHKGYNSMGIEVEATSSLAEDSIQTAVDSDFGVPTISNGGFQYYVHVIWQPDAASSSLRFCGCRIEYEITNLNP